MEFSDSINCILGENGNGKTNIIEAINVLVTKKSFRKNTAFPQLLSIDCEQPEIIISSVFKDEENILKTFSGKIFNNGQEWYLNSQPTKKKLEIGTIFINPFDSYGFHNTPSVRRTWIDQHLSLLDKSYKKSLNNYTTQLRFRNNLLSKKPNRFELQIKTIDEQIAKETIVIMDCRKSFLNQLSPFIKKSFMDIFSEEHELTISYDSKWQNLSEKQIYDTLQINLEKEKIVGHTLNGVHKDDYVFHFDGLNSYDYCSLGQQKMSFLSLLFAYIELFRYKFKSTPIVLLDDVSGELDKTRWKNLIEYLENCNFQIFITTANEKFREQLEQIENAKKFIVKNGEIETIS